MFVVLKGLSLSAIASSFVVLMIIGTYVRWGAVPSDRNEVISNIQFGLHTHGLIPSRSDG